MRIQTVTIFEDNVDRMNYVEAFALTKGEPKTIEDIQSQVRDAIADHEGFEFLHDDRISDIVDKINNKWDNIVHDLIVDKLNDLVMAHVDVDEIDVMEFNETQCFDSIPGIDVGALEDQFKNSRYHFVLEWKRIEMTSITSAYEVSSEKADYLVIINNILRV